MPSDLTDDERRVSGSVLRESIASGHTAEKQRDALCDEVARLRGEIDALRADGARLTALVEHDFALARAQYDADEGQASVEFRGAPLVEFAAIARNMLADAANYLEMQLQDDLGGLTLRVQRHEGQTPHQLRQQAEIERDALRAALAARDAEWLAVMPRCEHLDGNRCDAAATRECGDSTTGEWLFCDSHAPFTGETYRDLPQAPLIRRASARDGEVG